MMYHVVQVQCTYNVVEAKAEVNLDNRTKFFTGIFFYGKETCQELEEKKSLKKYIIIVP